MHTIIINSLEETFSSAQQFWQIIQKDYPQSRCIAFNGQMGAGKTTFITQLCKVLNVVDKVSSPTFSIVNQYVSPEFGEIYHFDLYRIKDTMEALNAGAEEYIFSDNYCFIEWPETLMSLLPENTIILNIEVKEGKRILTF